MVVLSGCFHVGAFLCRLCVSNVFDARGGFDVDASHVFPQGVLATIIWIGGVVCVRGSHCAEGDAGFPLCSVAVAALSGAGSVLKLLEWMP